MFDSWYRLPAWLRLSISFPLFFLNGWLLVILLSYLEPLGTMLTTATLLAFLLDFPIRLLEARGIQRGWATALVFLFALIILAILGLILIPIIVEQLTELLSNLPQWLESGNQQIDSVKKWAIANQLPIDFQGIIAQVAEKLSAILQSLGNQVLSLVGGTIGTAVNTLIILVLTIFLVLTGESVWTGIFSWVPQPWDVRLREIGRAHV